MTANYHTRRGLSALVNTSAHATATGLSRTCSLDSSGRTPIIFRSWDKHYCYCYVRTIDHFISRIHTDSRCAATSCAHFSSSGRVLLSSFVFIFVIFLTFLVMPPKVKSLEIALLQVRLKRYCAPRPIERIHRSALEEQLDSIKIPFLEIKAEDLESFFN